MAMSRSSSRRVKERRARERKRIAAIVGALKLLGHDADRVQPLFVTVDPGRDTPMVLQTYLAKFSPGIFHNPIFHDLRPDNREE